MTISTHNECDDTSQNNIVVGAIESLEQARSLVSELSQTQYTKICAPFVQSSIGSHVRHILDMYQALREGLEGESGVIDYDLRRRGSSIESSKTKALEDITSHLEWMKQTFSTNAGSTPSTQNHLTRPISIQTEVCLSHTAHATMPSNLAREMVFIASHAVHHFAILTVIAKLQDISISDSFGVAPATRTFLRDENTASVAECAQ